MHILHLIDKLSMEGRHPSSCAQMLVHWAAGMRSRGYFLEVAVLRPRDTVAGFLEQAGLPVIPIPFGSWSPRNVPFLVRLIRERRFSMLHLHGYGAADHGRVAARIAGVPAIVHEHAVLPVRPHQWVVDRLLRWWTDAAVAVSEEVRDFMVKGRSIPDTRIRVISNGIDLDRFEDLQPCLGAHWRARLGLSDRTPLVATVTRLHPLKGNRHLVDAVPQIVARRPEARVVIVGDGPEKAALEARAQALGVQDAVIFAGFVDDPAEVYAALDVFVLPSMQEGFGLAALEAMAAAKPVVVSAVGGLPRLVKDGVNGTLVPPGDAAALASGINQLLDNPGQARKLAAQARLDSRAFGIGRTLDGLAQLYASLIKQGS